MLRSSALMGSLEEETLVQMVHDFIESESATPICCSSTSDGQRQNPREVRSEYYTLVEVLRSRSDCESEVVEKVMRHMRNKRDAERSSSLKKWLVRRLKIDGFNASLCQNSWHTTLGCSAGEYEFIEVVMKEDNGGGLERVIVDIDFKSQFEVARPTSAYTELSEALPSIYVGNEDKLDKIINILSSAAKKSLRERGLHIPPWRTATYMRAKWLSTGADHSQKLPPPPPSHRHHHHHRHPYNAIDFISRENGEAKSSAAHGSSKWAPPMVKPKSRDLGGGSALSSQFSNMGINCC